MVSNDATAHDNRCCCHTGAKCICGIKKETIDLRLDTSRQTLHDVRTRPKVTSTHSESNLTVFANGHHRPCHRNNNSAHVSGAPYKIPRPHTLHGPSAFAAFAQGGPQYGQPESPAPRSMDTLSLSNNDFHAMFGSTLRSAVEVPLTPASGSIDTTGFTDSLFTGRSSTFGQGGHSPTESHLSDSIATPQWPWTSGMPSATRNFGYGSLSTSPSQDCLPNLDSEWAIPSAGLANPTWSAGDLPLDPSKLTDNLVQPISQSGESKQSAPGLTTSSSPSEMGEPALFGDLEFRAPPSTASESLFWDDSPVYRLGVPVSNDTRAPTSMPSTTPEPQGLEMNLSKTMATVPESAVSTSADLYSETQAIAMPTNVDDLASNDAWLLDQSNTAFAAFGTFDLPTYSNWL